MKLARTFTLIEVMIATIIVTISSIGLYSALMTSKRIAYGSRVRLEAQRFSYDLANKLSKLTTAELKTAISNIQNNSDISSCSDYLAINLDNPNSDDDTITQTVKLSNLNGKVELTVKEYKKDGTMDYNEVTPLDYEIGNILYIQVKVSWSVASSPEKNYTSVIYYEITQ